MRIIGGIVTQKPIGGIVSNNPNFSQAQADANAAKKQAEVDAWAAKLAEKFKNSNNNGK